MEAIPFFSCDTLNEVIYISPLEFHPVLHQTIFPFALKHHQDQQFSSQSTRRNKKNKLHQQETYASLKRTASDIVVLGVVI